MNSSLQSNSSLHSNSLHSNRVVSGPSSTSVAHHLADVTAVNIANESANKSANENTSHAVPQVWYDRGKMLVEKQRYNAAIASFDMALRSNPHDAKSLIWRGIALFHLNYYQSALRDFRLATEIAPESRAAWIFQGVVLKALERHSAALSCYQTALLLVDQDPVEEGQYPLGI